MMTYDDYIDNLRAAEEQASMEFEERCFATFDEGEQPTFNGSSDGELALGYATADDVRLIDVTFDG